MDMGWGKGKHENFVFSSRYGVEKENVLRISFKNMYEEHVCLCVCVCELICVIVLLFKIYKRAIAITIRNGGWIQPSGKRWEKSIADTISNADEGLGKEISNISAVQFLLEQRLIV